MSGKENWVDEFIERETDHVQTALENASRHFDENDNFDVHTLEAVYGAESSFGLRQKLGNRGDEYAGHFQIGKKTAKRFNISHSKENDQRFDIDDSSWAAAKYLKTLDNVFVNGSFLHGDLYATVIADNAERKKFVLAAYNSGEGRISKAQRIAAENGKNPVLWRDVKEFLVQAGEEPGDADKIIEYVETVLLFEPWFVRESPADKTVKDKEPLTLEEVRGNCRWRTIRGNPVCLEGEE